MRLPPVWRGCLHAGYENSGGTPDFAFHCFHGSIGKDAQVEGLPNFLLDFFSHNYGRLAAPSAGIAAVKYHYINPTLLYHKPYPLLFQGATR